MLRRQPGGGGPSIRRPWDRRSQRHAPEAQARLKTFAREYAKAEAKLEQQAERVRSKRDEAIRRAHRDGLPMATIAHVLGMSPQRVSPIVRS
jgi:predicted DNA-binding WGR domain protein